MNINDNSSKNYLEVLVCSYKNEDPYYTILNDKEIDGELDNITIQDVNGFHIMDKEELLYGIYDLYHKSLNFLLISCNNKK